MTTLDQSATLAGTLAATLATHLELFASRARALAGQLSEQEFWTRPYPYGNSVGHLLLHLTGNLNYYIGTQIAGTGYVRDRPLEFADTSRRPMADVINDVERAVAMAVATIRAQSAEDWVREYEATGSQEKTRLGMVLLCVHHFHHHQAQMIYLVKEHERLRPGGR